MSPPTPLPWSPGILPTLRGANQAELIRYPRKADLIEWAQENVKLGKDEAFRRFDVSFAPWTRAAARWFTDPEIEIIYLIQGSQTSKTLFMMLTLLYVAKHQPGRGMWISSDKESAQDFVEKRLKDMIEDSDARTSPAKRDWTKDFIRIFGMPLHVAWATSAPRMRGWPCPYIWGDEVGVWPVKLRGIGEPIEYSWKRTRMFRRRRKGIYATTPRDVHMPAWKRATQAPWHQWWVPCPRCGEFQYISWKQIKFDHCKETSSPFGPAGAGDKARWDRSRIKHETYFECAHCHAHIQDHEKLAMLQLGREQLVDPATYQALPALDAKPREISLQVPGMYSPFTTWGELALGFIGAKAQGSDTLCIFVTDEICEAWEDPADVPLDKDLAACIDEGRPADAVPEGTLAITAGVDVQLDHCYYVIRAWGRDRRSWLLRNGMIPRGDNRELDYLDDVLLSPYDGWNVAGTFVDSGYDPDYVYAYCAGRRGDHIYPCKGGTASTSAPVTHGPLQKGKHNRPVPQGLNLYMVNSHHFRSFVHDHIRVTAGDPGEWRLHAEVDTVYLRQVLNVKRARKYLRGIASTVWELIDTPLGCHYLDCEAYAAAAAWFPVQVSRIERGRGRPAPRRTPRSADGAPQAAGAGRTFLEKRRRR